jgi:hypothetical protein
MSFFLLYLGTEYQGKKSIANQTRTSKSLHLYQPNPAPLQSILGILTRELASVASSLSMASGVLDERAWQALM